MSVDHFTRILKYDGAIDAVFTYRTQPDTVTGTAWRFIMDRGKALVVTPYQSPKAPAPEAHSVPARIESVLAGSGGFGALNFALWAASETPERLAPNWETLIHEAAEAEASKKVKSFDKMSDEEQGAALRPLLDVHRERIESEREAYRDRRGEMVAEIEAEALTLLMDSLEAYGLKEIEDEKVKKLHDFIRAVQFGWSSFLMDDGRFPIDSMQEVIASKGATQSGKRMMPTDADLRRVLAYIGELTGQDITERVTLAYSEGMAKLVEDCAAETVEAEGMEAAEARRHVLERVKYMAVFDDGLCWPVQSAIESVHDAKDSKAFGRLALTPGDRERIAADVEAVRSRQEGAEKLTLKNRYRREVRQQRLVMRASIRKIFNLSEHDFNKGVDNELIKPVPMPGGGKHRYDVDQVMSNYPPALDDQEIAVEVNRSRK